MELEELKRKLMGLWEKNTHNSKELISILFDYYFDIRYLEYRQIEGKIISALFGIPYTFGYGKQQLKGMYIISLSSEEGFSKKGVLADLLQDFNNKMKEDFDFTFIIPHTELLADYYGNQGYFSSFFILEERYTPLHDFKNDYILSLTDSDERIRDLKKNLLDQITVNAFDDEGLFSRNQVINFIENIENKGSSSVNLIHTAHDLDYLLQENNLRNLNTYLCYDSDQRISGIAFLQKEDLVKRIRIVAIYVTDLCSYYALLNHVKKIFQDYSLSVVTSDPKYQTHSIMQLNYASSNPLGGDLDNTFNTVEIPFNINKLLQPLGMVKLLRFENILSYIAETRSDVEFKLHIRDLSTETEKKLFIIKNGKCQEEIYIPEKAYKTILNLTRKEVSELLLRKNDTSNLIMEAFGIPRLNLQIRLLPI